MNQRAKILVVDDNPATLRFIRSQLEELYQVVLARSGEMAVRAALDEMPDLVLLDVDMPGMNGFETLDYFKNYMVLVRIPVIFLTANQDTGVHVRALKSGAVDFITGPCEKTILIHRIALHLQLSRYRRLLEDKVQDLEENLIVSFAEMIECRDKNTGGHIQRTAAYMELLIKELMWQGQFTDQLDEETLYMFKKAALLHDIGKIGISDGILLKPDKLNNEEFAVMKTHTTIGERVLDSMYHRTPSQNYLAYARLIAGGHHEKFDGTGYPGGAAGDAIPLCARIMAVVDVYDAITSTRVYRSTVLSHEEAVDYIVSRQGRRFDPRVIKAFEHIHRQMSGMKKRFAA